MERPLSQPPSLHHTMAGGAPPSMDTTNMPLTEDTSDHTFHWHYGEVDDSNFRLHGRTLLVVVIIFSLLLFFAILCLYFKWACRYRLAIVSVRSAGVGGGPAATTASGKVGLDWKTIEGFPVKLHVVVEVGEEAQCPICLAGLVEGEKLKLMPGCEHGFHPDCVGRWLKSHTTCPICRASLDSPEKASPLPEIV